MNRIGTLGLIGALGLLTTACELGTAPMSHQSTLGQMTRGIVLHDADTPSDSGAQVGMSGTTCDWDPVYGGIGTDYNYPGEDETVDDVAENDNGDVQVVVSTDKTVHIQESGDTLNTSSRDYEIDGVLVAQNYENGAIVLTEGDGNDCSLVTVGTDNDTTYDLKGDRQCLGVHTLETDPTSGSAWVGSDAGLFSLEGAEMVTINEEPANIVAYDPYTDALYTAELGDSVVRAIEPDGTVRWETDVGASIFSLDDVGAEEAVAVSVNYTDGTGTGAVIFVDGNTGEIRTNQQTLTQNNTVVTSRDGSQLSLANSGGAEFYGVNPGLQGSAGNGWDVNWGDFGDDMEWTFE